MSSEKDFDEFFKKIEEKIEKKIEEIIERVMKKIEPEIEKKIEKTKYPAIYVDVNKIVSRAMEAVSQTINELTRRLTELGKTLEKGNQKIAKIFQPPCPKIIKIVEMPAPHKPEKKVRIIRFAGDLNTDEIISQIRKELETTLKEELHKSLTNAISQIPREELRPEMLEYAAEIFEVLANKERLKILFLLGEKDRYFVELKDTLKLSPSSLRLHLTKLMSLGLVRQEKARGKYQITEKGKNILAFLKQFLAEFKKYMYEEGNEE